MTERKNIFWLTPNLHWGILLIICMGLNSCKSKQFLTEAKATELVEINKIIDKQYNKNSDFNTLYIKSNVKFKDDKQSYNLTADIRIEKNKRILVSIRFFGITMAKALITPEEVKYYEKSGNKYFEGDFSTLSQWLGTDLDYTKIQNLLLGNPIDDLHQSKYSISLQNGLYKISDQKSTKVQKHFYFEALQFLVKKQEITQPQTERTLIINYPNHKSHEALILPSQVSIEASENQNSTFISIEYNTITINENLSFPYSVPNGFEKINIE